MVNIMYSLYNSVDSMRINQAGLSVVSNNIANMNTEGYSKQRLDLAAVSYNAGSVNQDDSIVLGGVAIDQITRYQDEFLNTYIMQEKSSLGYDKQIYDTLSSVESIFNETDETGLTGAFQGYFDAAQSLSENPTSKVARSNFISQSDNLAKEFNSKYEDLTALREDLVGNGIGQSSLNESKTGTIISDINTKLSQIADLNDQISAFMNQDGGDPNTLLDQRQLLLDQLSEEIPINTRYEGNSCNVFVGNVQLIDNGEQIGSFKATVGDVANPVTVSVVNTKDPTVVYATDYTNENTFPNDQGSLKAILDLGGSSDGSIYDVVLQLNSLAQEFAKSVNAIQIKADAGPPQQASLKMNGATGKLEIADQNIFLNDSDVANYDANAITAGNICINQAVVKDPFEIAASYANLNVAGTAPADVNATGNNNNALSFVNMRQEALNNMEGLTAESKLYSIASQIGNSSALAKAQQTSQQTSVDQLTDKRSSITGVSLDEELVDLMKYQKAYQASARVFSAVNQMMDAIINMMS